MCLNPNAYLGTNGQIKK
uniref:Uncharacterized protein n=1 Tax=Rhizophora mucronata TaxID=61149 RepID=A0A2P2PWC0_RHIMU